MMGTPWSSFPLTWRTQRWVLEWRLSLIMRPEGLWTGGTRQSASLLLAGSSACLLSACCVPGTGPGRSCLGGMRRRGMRFGCDVSEERGAELDSTRISILAVTALIHKGPSVLPQAFTPPTRAAEQGAGEPCGLLPRPSSLPPLLPSLFILIKWKLVASYTRLQNSTKSSYNNTLCY